MVQTCNIGRPIQMKQKDDFKLKKNFGLHGLYKYIQRFTG